MSRSNSVTRWIHVLQSGDETDEATRQLWDRYFGRLVALARKRLESMPRRSEDEEDVALEALQSFFEGARQGHFPQLNDRSNLWTLLATITTRRSLNLREKQFARKRGAGRVRGESVFWDGKDSRRGYGIEEFVVADPTPEFADRLNDECRQLLDKLGDDSLRNVARYKMMGYTNAEIAERMNIVRRTVERKLKRIQRIWESELQ